MSEYYARHIVENYDDGECALRMAAKRGQTAVVEVLLKNGRPGCVCEAIDNADRFGKTSTRDLLKREYPECGKALAGMDHKEIREYLALHVPSQREFNLGIESAYNSKNMEVMSVILMALKEADKRWMKHLLEACIFYDNSFAVRTILSVTQDFDFDRMAKLSIGKKDTAVLELLLKYVDEETVGDLARMSAKNNHVDAMQILVSWLRRNAPTYAGPIKASLWIASENGHVDIVRMLLDSYQDHASYVGAIQSAIRKAKSLEIIDMLKAFIAKS